MKKSGKQKKSDGVRESATEYGKQPAANPPYDLEDRTFRFAQNVRAFVKMLSQTIANTEDIRQPVRSSGSVGANYIEANENLGKKDFLLHIRISRKEAKESRFWLRLLDTGGNERVEKERAGLVQEAGELTNIFGAIYRRTS